MSFWVNLSLVLPQFPFVCVDQPQLLYQSWVLSLFLLSLLVRPLYAQAPSTASISSTHVQASVSAPSPVSDLASESSWETHSVPKLSSVSVSVRTRLFDHILCSSTTLFTLLFTDPVLFPCQFSLQVLLFFLSQTMLCCLCQSQSQFFSQCWSWPLSFSQ